VLVAGDIDTWPESVRQSRVALTRRPGWQFDTALGVRKLCEQLRVASLAGLNAHDLAVAQAAAAALLSYAEHTQGRALAHVRTLSVERASELLELPPATHRNLELTQTLRGEDSPTLLSVLDTCRNRHGQPRAAALAHASGARSPQRVKPPRNHRGFHRAGPRALREALRQVSDVERITARVALRQVRPRELAGLRATLQSLPALRSTLPAEPSRCWPNLPRRSRRRRPSRKLLQSAIAEDRPCCCAKAA
jgi:DNA mismatch repair protein MutS